MFFTVTEGGIGGRSVRYLMLTTAYGEVLFGCAETAGHPNTRQGAWDEYSCGGGSAQMSPTE